MQAFACGAWKTEAMEDPHKRLRGLLLDRWITANGGAVRCLTGAGYEPGSKEFKSRETHLSQSRKMGLGHRAALRWETEFESLGMAPGELTNDLDSRNGGRVKTDSPEHVSPPLATGVTRNSVKDFTPSFPANAFNRTHRAPIVSWGRMGVDALSRETLNDGELVAPVDFGDSAVVWRVEDDSMSPDYNQGDFIAIDSDPATLNNLAAGEAVIVETSGGTKILRYYTPLADGHFEARPPAGSRYGSLSTLQMQLQVRAVVQAHLRLRRSFLAGQ